LREARFPQPGLHQQDILKDGFRKLLLRLAHFQFEQAARGLNQVIDRLPDLPSQVGP
jgi:hypothetical protein